MRFKEGSVDSESDATLGRFLSLLITENARLSEFHTVSETRPTDPDYGQGYRVMFTDAFLILIAPSPR